MVECTLELVHYVYDPAGNLLQGGRRAPGATVTYDAMNRPIRVAGASSTDTLTYDANGNVLTGNNRYARVTRTYFPAGWLATERQQIATANLSPADFTQHVFDLRFTYDLGGRRDTLVHPAQWGGQTSYAYDPRTGQLALVIDPAGNRFRYHYDVMGRLDTLVRLDSRVGKLTEAMSYDLRSRVATRRIVGDSAGTLVNDSYTYDVRDKILAVGANTITYDLFGQATHLVLGSQDSQYKLDAMGNRWWGREDGGHLSVTETNYAYTPGTGRIERQFNPQHVQGEGDTTYTQYDSFGNLSYSLRQLIIGTTPTRTLEWKRSNNFDANNRMSYSELVYDTVGVEHQYVSSERYRYDAFGRRVWMHTVRDTSCSLVNGVCRRDCDTFEPATGCISPMTRVAWDGDQILYEIRADGKQGTSSVQQENDNTLGALFGVVGYTHGLGIDTPLDVRKGSDLVIPLPNWRGKFDRATCPAQSCTSSQYVFPEIRAFGATGWVTQPPPNWYGSLLEGQRDGSGYIYQRNRYLDPNTGRFTQEDPIGLAGGMNLYGFVGGDPVTYSDPFGLCTKPDPRDCDVIAQILDRIDALYNSAAGKMVQGAAKLMDLFTPVGDFFRAKDGTDPISGEHLSTGSRIFAGFMVLASLTDDEVKALQYWHRATFGSEAASAAYHLKRHGGGRSLVQYTEDALNFFEANRTRGTRAVAKDGAAAIVIRTKGGPGGWFTEDGKIITFWYK